MYDNIIIYLLIYITEYINNLFTNLFIIDISIIKYNFFEKPFVNKKQLQQIINRDLMAFDKIFNIYNDNEITRILSECRYYIFNKIKPTNSNSINIQSMSKHMPTYRSMSRIKLNNTIYGSGNADKRHNFMNLFIKLNKHYYKNMISFRDPNIKSWDEYLIKINKLLKLLEDIRPEFLNLYKLYKELIDKYKIKYTPLPDYV